MMLNTYADARNAVVCKALVFF